MPVTGMSSVWYPVQDWERSKRFYTEILGLRLEACSDDAGWAALRAAGESGIPFFLVKKPDFVRTGGGGVVGFDVTEVGALLAAVAEFGCRVSEAVQESSTVRIYTIFDPDGNALELSEAVRS